MDESAPAKVEAILRNLTSSTFDGSILYLLSGERGDGKTSWCKELAAAARASDLVLGGVISPGVYAGSRRIAIDLEDLHSQETRRLATRRSDSEYPAPARKWAFDPQAIDWGNHLFGSLGEVDLLIVDEIGPLELLEGKGLQAALLSIDRAEYRAGVIVVRPSLLEIALRRWPDAYVLKLPRGGASESSV